MPDDYLDSLSATERAAMWRSSLESPPRPRASRLVATVEDEVVGFALVGPASSDADAGVGELYAINVVPDHWGTGAAPALIDAATAALRTCGFASAVLWVHPDNVRARRFYAARGWIDDRVERRETVLGVDVPEVRLSLASLTADTESTAARTRSEFRLSPIVLQPSTTKLTTRSVLASDRDELAALMLDAYQGTVDDEGETTIEALEAVDHYLSLIVHKHSFLVTEASRVVAMAFTVVVDEVHYVDPIVVAAHRKQSGIGREAVTLVLESLAGDGIAEVGATITDGNIASERLFLGLGFTRRGAWPRPK